MQKRMAQAQSSGQRRTGRSVRACPGGAGIFGLAVKPGTIFTNMFISQQLTPGFTVNPRTCGPRGDTIPTRHVVPVATRCPRIDHVLPAATRCPHIRRTLQLYHRFNHLRFRFQPTAEFADHPVQIRPVRDVAVHVNDAAPKHREHVVKILLRRIAAPHQR
jgi:hypothetical protein